MNFKICKIIFSLLVAISVSFCFYLVIVQAQTGDPTANEEITDSDHDGLTDNKEINIYKTDPAKWDTDGDGYGDGDEVWNGYSPLLSGDNKNSRVDANKDVLIKEEKADSDHDGLFDNDEINIYKTDPAKWDTDSDGYGDGDEVWSGYSPLLAGDNKISRVDMDNDGLNDALEIALGTDLKKPDTDDDGYTDGQEVYTGFSPTQGKFVRETNKWAEVDLTNQRMDYYFKGIKIGTILVSTGKAPLLTPTGNFSIIRKRPVVNYSGYPNTKWNLEFKKGYYVHGAYWHSMFGKKSMSHGCVNVAYKDMENFYSFMDIGSPVKIFGKTPSGVITTND